MSKFLSDLYSVSNKRKNSAQDFSLLTSFPLKDDVQWRRDSEAHYASSANIPFPEVKIIGSGANEQKINQSSTSGASAQTALHVELPKLVNNVLGYLNSEEYIEGEISKTHLYLEALHGKYPAQFLDVFQQVWLHLFKSDASGLRNFICIAAGLNYNILKDRADALIIGAVAHSDEDVNEAGIRAVESWGISSHYDLVSNLRPFSDPFLEAYRMSVLEELKEGK